MSSFIPRCRSPPKQVLQRRIDRNGYMQPDLPNPLNRHCTEEWILLTEEECEETEGGFVCLHIRDSLTRRPRDPNPWCQHWVRHRLVETLKRGRIVVRVVADRSECSVGHVRS